MIAAWLLQIGIIYGTVKITKFFVKKDWGKLGKRKKKNKNEIFQAELLDKEGKNITGKKEFTNLEDALKWTEKFVDKNEKVDIKIQNEESHKENISKAIEFNKNDVTFNSEEIQESIINFENENKENYKEIVKKKGLYTEEEKDNIEKDIYNHFYNNSEPKEKLDYYLKFNKDLNKELDQQIKDINKHIKVRFKNAKYEGNKEDLEAKIGFEQQNICNKVALINYISNQKNLNKNVVLPADFINQPMFENIQEIKSLAKVGLKIKDFGINTDRETIFEKKSPRCMNVEELNKWNKENREKIEVAKNYAIINGKYKKANVDIALLKAENYINNKENKNEINKEHFQKSLEGLENNKSLSKPEKNITVKH